MVLSRLHRRRGVLLTLTLLAATFAVISAPTALDCQSAHASDTQPVDYCWQIEIAITNDTGGDLTDYMVRVPIDAAGLVSADRLDARAWDILPVQGSLSNEIFLMAQDMDDGAAGWWFFLPSITDNETKTIRLYTGSSEQRRDQAFRFSTTTHVIADQDAALEPTGASSIVKLGLTFSKIDAIGSTSKYLVDNRTGTTGYEIRMTDSAITFVIDGGTCSLTWDSAWDNQFADWQFEYFSAPAPDTFIYRNGVLEETCDLDQSTIAYGGVDLVLGTSSNFRWPGGLPGVALRQFTLGTGASTNQPASTPILRWDFNAKELTETSTSPVYIGTVTDLTGNGHTGTYELGFDQTNITTTVSAPSLAGGQSQIVLSDSAPAVLGDAYAVNPGTNSEVTTGAFYSVFVDKWASASPVRSFGYAMVLSIVGLLLAIGTYRVTRYIPVALFMFGIPLAVGVANGWIAGWWMIIWVLFGIGGWFAQRQSETA